MTTRVSFLGPQGTFTEQALANMAARGVFGCAADAVDAVPAESPAAAMDLVRAGDCAFAVAAIENSVDGAVTPTFDALAEGGVHIYAECDLAIAFSIMVRPGATDEKAVTRFATHPVARPQVALWLETHMPQAEFVPAASNGAAAKMVADGEVDAAAAPATAAALFGLEELATGVADHSGATTRFVAIGAAGKPPARTGNDRTSVVFTLPNKPGSLVTALTEFSLRGVDMTRIESRPTKTSLGTYRFYTDIVGHIEDQPVADALRALHMHCENLLFLGSWPAGDGDPSGGDDMHTEQLLKAHAADLFIAAIRGGGACE